MARKIFDAERLVARFRRLKDVRVTVASQADGDHDTAQVILRPEGRRPDGQLYDSVTVTGFTLADLGPNKLRAPVDMVEVKGGLFSRGGLSSSHLRTCLLYGRVCSILRRRGFEVVPQLRDFF